MSLMSAIIGGIIGIIGTLLTIYFSKKRLKVSYGKTSISSLMNVSDEIRDKIKIEYENESISNIYSFKVKIQNTGNAVVEKLPILFEFDTNTKILDVDIETIPQREFIIKKIDDNKKSEIKYEIDFLNPNDQIFVSFLTADNESEYLKLYARAKGLRFYETEFISYKELFIGAIKFGLNDIFPFNLFQYYRK